jgi:hypothetical protein
MPRLCSFPVFVPLTGLRGNRFAGLVIGLDQTQFLERLMPMRLVLALGATLCSQICYASNSTACVS